MSLLLLSTCGAQSQVPKQCVSMSRVRCKCECTGWKGAVYRLIGRTNKQHPQAACNAWHQVAACTRA